MDGPILASRADASSLLLAFGVFRFRCLSLRVLDAAARVAALGEVSSGKPKPGQMTF